jgi:hypothetical protein
MMPLKWKIFRVANIIQFIYAVGIFIFIAFNLSRRGFYKEDLFFLSTPFGFLFMGSNNYLNLYIFSKFFPNQLIPTQLEKISTISFVINILFNIPLIILIIAGSIEEFGSENTRDFWTGKIVLAGLLLILINWLYVLFMQLKLKRIIKREYYASINEILNSLGR